VKERIVLKLIEKLRRREAVVMQSAAQQYRGLVKDVADDANVPEERALAICEAAGKTADDLERDASRLLERRRLHATMKAADAKAKDLEKARADIEAEESRFAKLQAEHDQRIRAYSDTVFTCTQAIYQADSAARTLIEGARDEALLAEREKLEGQRQTLIEEAEELKRRIEGLERALAHNLGVAERNDDDDSRDVVEGQRGRLREAVARRRAIDGEIGAINTAVETFNRERLTSPDA
jgi:hypothetical protein